MKKIFKKNQVILTLLAVMIVVAGYLNYAGKADKDSITNADVDTANGKVLLDISEADIIAENESAVMANTGQSETEDATLNEDNKSDMTNAELDADAETSQDTTASSGELIDMYTVAEEPDSKPNIDDTPGEAVLTNGMTVVDYVAGVQLGREQTRAKNKETLNELINNESLSEEQRQSAVDSMLKLTELAGKESTTESLLGAKGFDNSIVCISDEYVDVIVGRKSITDAEKAQIEDIVKRETGYELSDIVITLLEIEE